MNWLNLLGINTAYAASSSTAAHPQSSLLSMLPMLIIFVLVFYFLLLRPQQKRAKQQRALLQGLAKGDEVITSGGVAGKIVKVSDDFVVVTIAENVDITVQKNAVSNVLPKGSLKAV